MSAQPFAATRAALAQGALGRPALFSHTCASFLAQGVSMFHCFCSVRAQAQSRPNTTLHASHTGPKALRSRTTSRISRTGQPTATTNPERRSTRQACPTHIPQATGAVCVLRFFCKPDSWRRCPQAALPVRASTLRRSVSRQRRAGKFAFAGHANRRWPNPS